MPVPDFSNPIAQIVSQAASHTLANELVDVIADRVAERLQDVLSPSALLDINGAAERLNVSPRTVETLIALGEIPVVRIGAGRGVRRFEQTSIDAFIRRSTRTLG